MLRLPLPSFPLVLTVLSWGFNFVALKLLYRELSPPAAGIGRWALMYAMLLAICIALREPLRFPKGKTLPVLWQGFLSMGLYMIFFLEGMKRTGAAEGAIILATAPVITALFAAMFKQEPLRAQAVYGGLVSFVGVALVVIGGSAGSTAPTAISERILGDILILCSATVWSFQAVISRPLMKEASPWRLMTLGTPAALVALLPYGAIDTVRTDWSALSAQGWAMLGYFALFAGVIGFFGFYYGVRKLGATRTLLYQFFVPPTAALSEWLVFGRVIGPLQVVGLLVVIAGVALASRGREAVEPRADPV